MPKSAKSLQQRVTELETKLEEVALDDHYLMGNAADELFSEE